MSLCHSVSAATPFLLRFQSLLHVGRALVFPCDEKGCVALDALNERQRENYLFARVVVGHEYSCPVVTRCGAQAPEPCQSALRVARDCSRSMNR